MEMTKKNAHAAGKHYMGAGSESRFIDCITANPLICVLIAIAAIFGSFNLIGIGIELFESFMRWCVIQGANPFGWS